MQELLKFAMTTTLLLCPLLGVPDLQTKVSDDSRLMGRDISMVLLKQSDSSRTTLADGNVKLTVHQVTVRQGASVRALLQSNGIYADANSLGLIYDLNPGVDSLASPKPDSTLILLKVAGGRELQKQLSSGYLVALTVDQKLKDDMRKNVERLTALAPRIASLEPNRFGNAGAKEAVVKSIDNTMSSLKVVKRGLAPNSQFPLSNEILTQIAGEVEILLSILDPDQNLSAANQVQIGLIDKDLQVKMRAFEEIRSGELPGRWPEVRVVVTTLKSGDQGQVPSLRVYYVAEALYGRPGLEKTFDKLSSPTDRIIPEANYRIWAGRGDDPSPVSDVRKVEVRKDPSGRELTVELLIIR